MKRALWVGTLALFGLAVAVYVVAAAWMCWWEEGVPICTASGDRQRVSIATDGESGALIVWEDYRDTNNGDPDIYVQRVDASGGILWSEDGAVVCTAATRQTYPTVIPDGSGGAIAVWYGDESVFTIHAQRLDANGSLMWGEDGMLLAEAGGLAFLTYPVALSDGSGGTFVAYGLVDYNEETSSVLGQRISSTGDLMWTEGGVVLWNADQPMALMASSIISDGFGGVIVVGEGPGLGAIYAQRVDALGNLQWGANAVRVTGASVEATGPTAVCDDSAGVIVAWTDCSSYNEDIYAQRVSSSGDLMWFVDGVPVCTAAGKQLYPASTSDGVGGSIISWADQRQYGDHDVYAQRLDSEGNVLWPSNGVKVCEASGAQGYSGVDIVCDGDGGAIIAFDNYNALTRSDVYVQRISSMGSLLWTAVGAPACSTGGYQGNPVAVSDGYNGAIVAWLDRRDGSNNHIYAQRACGCQYVGAPEDWRSGYTLLAQNTPNPFSIRTRISFSVDQAGFVRLQVFDANGRLVRTLVDGICVPNHYVEYWDGKDNEGNQMPSGVYFFQVKVGDLVETKRMVLVR